MNARKQQFVVAFALFSLFFGAGNLILPPQLGFKSGPFWWLVALGFCLSAVLIPLLGILAHARLQGTMYDFGKKVSPTFSLVYCYLVYAISIGLPSPRTASVTHEMGVAPLFDTPSLLTSFVYFALVFLFVMNRSKILDIIGKLMTPAIILILFSIIGVAVFSMDGDFGGSGFTHPFSAGILEGYQTFDAIGAVVVGGVIIISINLKNKASAYHEKRKLIGRAGWLAGLGLCLIYTGLILTGALMQGEFAKDINRTALLSGISLKTLGNTANLFLSLLVSLACFTTAMGIVTGTADFVKGRFNDSQRVYMLTALFGCILGVLMGQFNVGYIIAVALPVLMLIYPITIVLIVLNVLPEKYTSKKIFRWTVITTILFSIPDFFVSLGFEEGMGSIKNWIPLSAFHMGWVVPALVVFIICNVFLKKQGD
ncbi:branched-chain amino acid transport system II carrier protein [Flagellimonas lutaonensis]|uniref:Branched-chain amino acid transport system carrier protein n=1 Tax=Flagellimonas lutaonensis TaxID=516051 RepID=A0A0D5YT53_9FLAO|nr:branched-chain amino acid transport system II carrier protein [Allomuricauda lutaonensis]AKA35069.1 Branched-chain amino acid transport system carrier protein [Allomuricauda lutaonensis]